MALRALKAWRLTCKEPSGLEKRQAPFVSRSCRFFSSVDQARDVFVCMNNVKINTRVLERKHSEKLISKGLADNFDVGEIEYHLRELLHSHQDDLPPANSAS